MKNSEKRNQHQLQAWNRNAGVHQDQNKKQDKKYSRRQARKEEKREHRPIDSD